VQGELEVMGLDFVLYAPAIEGADLKAISALEPYAHVSLMDSHGRKYVVLDSPLRYSSPLGTLSSVSCGRPACALDWWLDSVVHYRVHTWRMDSTSLSIGEVAS